MSLKLNKEPLTFIKNISEVMQQHDMHYFYRGYFTQEVIVDILTIVEKNMLGNNYVPRVKKKIYNLLVEALQNITRHQIAPPLPRYKNTSIVAIQSKPDRYLLSTANLIDADDKVKVKERIDYINSLDNEGLKDYYKAKLVKGNISDKGGAGLGLIDMARRSGSFLAYDFCEPEPGIIYFYFRMEVISSKNTPRNFQSCQFTYPMTYLKDLHITANKEKLSLIYNHNLNIERTDNLLEHLNKQLSDTAKAKSVIYNIAFDMLNILVRHTLNTSGADQPVVFFLKEDHSKIWLNAGCYLNNQDLPHYQSRIAAIERMRDNMGNSSHSKTRLEKLKALKKINYKFIDVAPGTSFLSIKVIV